jgi:ribulose-5-phosphate 4-epimerase/fuculose-1-phosphate aldolase
VKISNLILADHKGKVIEGEYAINRAGIVLHGAVHEEYPDVMAMCHAHTTYGTAWCATGRPLDMISQDAAAFYDSHAVIGASAGAVAVERESGWSVAREIGRNRGVLHQNHGLLTTSRHSIDDAAFWFIALERACQQQLMVEATGIKPQILSQKTAEYSREHVGSDYIGWLHFQTLYGQIARTQPDMFD